MAWLPSVAVREHRQLMSRITPQNQSAVGDMGTASLTYSCLQVWIPFA